MINLGVIINGIEYNVGVAKISRSLRKEYKYQVTTEDGQHHSEIRNIYMDFSLELGNVNSDDYDLLISALRLSPGDITVTLPSGKTKTETYIGNFDGISDEIITQDGDEYFWDNLTLNFTGTVPLKGDENENNL